jgi:hypothetical protein
LLGHEPGTLEALGQARFLGVACTQVLEPWHEAVEMSLSGREIAQIETHLDSSIVVGQALGGYQRLDPLPFLCAPRFSAVKRQLIVRDHPLAVGGAIQARPAASESADLGL